MIKDSAWQIVGYITAILNIIFALVWMMYSIWWLVVNKRLCTRYLKQGNGSRQRRRRGIMSTDNRSTAQGAQPPPTPSSPPPHADHFDNHDGKDKDGNSQLILHERAIRWFFVSSSTLAIVGMFIGMTAVSHLILVVDIQAQTGAICTTTEMIGLMGTLVALYLSQLRPVSIAADRLLGRKRRQYMCRRMTVGYVATVLFFVCSISSIMILGWVSSKRTHQDAASPFAAIGGSCGWYSDPSSEGTGALIIFFMTLAIMLCSALYLANHVWVEGVQDSRSHGHAPYWDHMNDHLSTVGIFVWSNVVFLIGISLATVIIATTWIGARDLTVNLNGYGAPHGISSLMLTLIIIMSTSLFILVPTASVHYSHHTNRKEVPRDSEAGHPQRQVVNAGTVHNIEHAAQDVHNRHVTFASYQ
jgi:hypothetical protein